MSFHEEAYSYSTIEHFGDLLSFFLSVMKMRDEIADAKKQQEPSTRYIFHKQI